MDYDRALGLMDLMLWNALLIAGPVLFTALIVGVLVSVLQVATQLQELTLSYVPKLLATGTILVLLGPWMLHNLTQFAQQVMATIPELG